MSGARPLLRADLFILSSKYYIVNCISQKRYPLEYICEGRHFLCHEKNYTSFDLLIVLENSCTVTFQYICVVCETAFVYFRNSKFKTRKLKSAFKFSINIVRNAKTIQLLFENEIQDLTSFELVCCRPVTCFLHQTKLICDIYFKFNFLIFL